MGFGASVRHWYIVPLLAAGLLPPRMEGIRMASGPLLSQWELLSSVRSEKNMLWMVGSPSCAALSWNVSAYTSRYLALNVWRAFNFFKLSDVEVLVFQQLVVSIFGSHPTEAQCAVAADVSAGADVLGEAALPLGCISAQGRKTGWGGSWVSRCLFSLLLFAELLASVVWAGQTGKCLC